MEYLPWGKSGIRAVCLLEHGPIAIAENGRVVIDGNYLLGKEVGDWHWYDAAGNLSKTKSHSSAN